MTLANIRVREVAKQLSLSPGTVSKALRGRLGQVSLATTKTVLNYCRNQGTISKPDVDRILFKMVSNSSGKNIFCISGKDIDIYSNISSSISNFIQGYGQYTSYYKARNENELSGFPFSKTGSLVVLGRLPMEVLLAFKRYDIPMVLVDNRINEEMGVSTVSSENLRGVSKSVKILADLGHKKIAFLRLFEDHGRAYNLSQRYDGYVLGMIRAGLSFDDLIFQRESKIDYQLQSHDSAVSELRELANDVLSLKDRPTAIIAVNDLTAYVVRQVATEKGLRVPEDLSIIGYDGWHRMPAFSLFADPVSTMVVNWDEIGMQAANLAVELMTTPNIQPKHLEVPVTYEDAGTVAVPGGK